jgi:hypothetical protein
MFRRGGSTNTGIMSGLVDREQKSFGDVAGRVEKLTPEFEKLLSQYTPRTRLPFGEVGFALATGTPFLEALGAGYRQFTKADDARQRAIKSGALKLGIAEATKKPTDIKELRVLNKAKDDGIITLEQYNQAIKNLALKDVTPKEGFKVLSETEAKDLLKGAYQEGKAYQQNKDPMSKDFNKIFEIGGSGVTVNVGKEKTAKQQAGQLTSEAAINKAIQNVSFVTEIGENIDKIDAMLDENPQIAGLSGQVLRFGNKAVSAAENFGQGDKIKNVLKKFKLKDKIVDTDIATLEALEDALAPAYARVLFPDAKTITNKMIEIAREDMKITGFTGAREVQDRLAEIKRQFNEYIKNQNVLIGTKSVDSNIKKFKVVNGKLVEQ